MLRNLKSASQVKRQMSIEEEKKPQPKVSLQIREKQSQTKKLQQVLHYTNSIRFHQIVGGLFDPTQTDLMLQVPLAVVPGIKKRHLVVKNLVYIISNWTHDKFPNVIYICLEGYLNGYKRVTQNPNDIVSTNRVAAIQLDSVSATMDQSSVRTYELRYTVRDSVTWQLPETLLELKFKMQIDDEGEYQIMPLPNPLDFNFEIRQSP